MLEQLLEQSVFKNGQEVSFILGHAVLAKSEQDWSEVKGKEFTMEEWEDLKDLCLQGNEKVQLETKGFVSGIFSSQSNTWKFSFIEKRECFRAYFSLIKNLEQTKSWIESPLFWETVKKKKGIFIVAGERRQGKTALLQEVLITDQKNKLALTGIHSTLQGRSWPQIDCGVQLGLETIDFEFNHILYDGIERIVVDLNAVKNWKKWIDMAEQGQSVLISISGTSVKSVINKIISELDNSGTSRFIDVLNGVIVQKLVGIQDTPCTEMLVVRESQRSLLHEAATRKSLSALNFQESFKESYQSLNQTIIQKLIRRKVDVQSAFEASDDPETLDSTLKKMGL